MDFCSLFLVFLTLCLMLWLPITTQVTLNNSNMKTLILKPWLEPDHPLLSSLFALGTISTWINYFLAMFSSPGIVPKSYKAKTRDGFRWCGKCQCYKPPRSHHCSQCRRCILKMDHHCNILSNSCA
jgi:hypothetical protein